MLISPVGNAKCICIKALCERTITNLRPGDQSLTSRSSGEIVLIHCVYTQEFRKVFAKDAGVFILF